MIKTLNRDIIGVIVVIALLAMSPFVMSLVYSYTKTNKVCPYGKMTGVKSYKSRDGKLELEYIETDICKTRNPSEYLLEVSTFGKPE